MKVSGKLLQTSNIPAENDYFLDCHLELTMFRLSPCDTVVVVCYKLIKIGAPKLHCYQYWKRK